MIKVSEPKWDLQEYFIRNIYLNSFDEFDVNNIGCHWSKDHGYMHAGGGEAGLTNTDLELFQIFVKSDSVEIDINATEMSNEECGVEQEIVLDQNQNISILYYNTEDDEYYRIEGNTGNRVDSWVASL